jgi:hypothetical protein
MKSWIVRETPRGFVCGPKSYFAWCNDCTKRKKPCLADWLSSQERGLGEGLAGNELAQRGRRARWSTFSASHVSRGGSGGASHDGISICAAPPMIPSARAIDRCHH